MGAVTKQRQLAFPFPQPDFYAPEDFLRTGATEEAWTWLEKPAAWPSLRLALHGEAGTGKTHLLHVFARRWNAVLVPGEALRHFDGIEPQSAIAIDDAEAMPEPEALLHLLNAAAEQQIPVLLASRSPPAQWRKTLPDLDSRLRAITAVGLGLPDEDLLRALFARLVADRQLRVEEAVQDYLLTRLPRSGAALREAAARLDHASLAAGRRVTRRIAADTLAGMALDDPADEVFVPESAGPSRNGARLL